MLRSAPACARNRGIAPNDKWAALHAGWIFYFARGRPKRYIRHAPVLFLFDSRVIYYPIFFFFCGNTILFMFLFSLGILHLCFMSTRKKKETFHTDCYFFFEQDCYFLIQRCKSIFNRPRKIADVPKNYHLGHLRRKKSSTDAIRCQNK